MKTLDRVEAAAFLKCDPDTVGHLVAQGELPCARIGRAQVFMDESLEAYIRCQSRKHPDGKEFESITCRAIQEPGVYLLLRSGEVVYVGQSVNPMRRVGEHLLDKRFDSFAFIPTPVDDLLSSEAAYINRFCPEYNIER
jgi:hypothetical protein